MPQSTALSPEHKALIRELCGELALTAAEHATVLATFEHQYRLSFEPRPEHSRLGIDILAPLLTRETLNMAVDPGRSPTKARATRRQLR